MDVIEIMKDAFYYPINNTKNWLIISLIFLINGILQQLAVNYSNQYLTIVVTVISIIIYIMIAGIAISIMRTTFDNSSEIPLINPIINLVDGIKYIITDIIYFIIPTIIITIIAVPVTGSKIANIINTTVSLNTTNTTQLIEAIPQNLILDLFVSIGVVTIIALILYIVFALLFNIALGRLAETDSIAAALNIAYIIKRINNIGIGKYVYYIILLVLFLFVFAIISGLITLIPYVGVIIETFIIQSFIIVFLARATALIYMEGQIL